MFKLILILALQIILFLPQASAKNHSKTTRGLKRWDSTKLLEPTERRPARTAILIIAPLIFNDGPAERRWKLGKKVWEQYMNSHPNVDCYFIQCTSPRKDTPEQVWLEGNTIFVGDPWTEQTGHDQILLKTVRALEWLGNNYTHYIRTNINTFFNLAAVADYAETHPQSQFTTPLWEKQWYAIGYAMIFTADVKAHIIREYNRLKQAGEELIDPNHSDDAALTALATGVWPHGKRNPFHCCPSLPSGVRQLMCINSLDTKRLSKYGALLTPVHSLQEATYYFDKASDKVILYRTRDGLDLNQFKILYEHMLSKIYPRLKIDLSE